MIAKMALFALADRVFALPVEGVRHIVYTPRIFPLPLLRKGIRGVFLHQGEVVPLLDLWQVLGQKAPTSGGGGQFTVVHSTELGLVGLPVSHVLTMVNPERGTLEEETDGNKVADPAPVFICKGRRYPLLDIEKLVNSLPP